MENFNFLCIVKTFQFLNLSFTFLFHYVGSWEYFFILCFSLKWILIALLAISTIMLLFCIWCNAVKKCFSFPKLLQNSTNFLHVMVIAYTALKQSTYQLNFLKFMSVILWDEIRFSFQVSLFPFGDTTLEIFLVYNTFYWAS